MYLFIYQEGDRIGLVRKSSGALHYFINGMDQGVASARTPSTFWGVVDLYGMAVKVTIMDHSDPDYRDFNRYGTTLIAYLLIIQLICPYCSYFDRLENSLIVNL